MGFTGPSAMLLEVRDELCRVSSKIAEVNGLAALLEEEETVEDLEQFGGRLMNPEGTVS